MSFLTEKAIMRAAFQEKRVWIVQLLGNAAIVVLIYWWLSIPDRRITDLVLSGVAGVLIVFAAVWMHTAALARFEAVHAGESNARGSLRRLPAMVVWAVVFVGVIFPVYQLSAYQERTSNWLASSL